MTDALAHPTWPEAHYREAANAVLTRIESSVDAWLERDVIDIDTARAGGMLTLTLPGGSQLIVNLQPPLQELWLAARSGGFHFRLVGDAPGQALWRDTRDGSEFFEVLARCLHDQAGASLRF